MRAEENSMEAVAGGGFVGIAESLSAAVYVSRGEGTAALTYPPQRSSESSSAQGSSESSRVGGADGCGDGLKSVWFGVRACLHLCMKAVPSAASSCDAAWTIKRCYPLTLNTGFSPRLGVDIAFGFQLLAAQR